MAGRLEAVGDCTRCRNPSSACDSNRDILDFEADNTGMLVFEFDILTTGERWLLSKITIGI